MLKRIIATTALCALTAGAAFAAKQPANVDECLQQSYDLAQSAAKKGLDEAKLADLEKLLTAMEGHCDKEEFDKAHAVSKDISAAIDG